MTKKGLIELYKAEIENIDKVLKMLSFVAKGKSKRLSAIEIAGVGVYIHNFYNGIENILKRTLLACGIKIKENPFWHKELLQTALKKGIIDEGLYSSLLDYLTFRHYFIHGYAFRLALDKMTDLLGNIGIVYKKFKKSIEAIVFSIE